ncbi:MAG: HDOD domain-containing protein [candidate division Zixibacteria bacterium]|nr:HDOD domain-containing protein [candidate division Zixibacteria bacterium]
MIVTKSIADRVKEMPMLSVVSTRLMELLGEENYSVRDVVGIVENDAILTSKILRAANSVAFSPRVPITSVMAAINNMGEKVIMGIAIESCAPKVFNEPLGGYMSEAGQMWDHSLCTAIGARILSSYTIKESSSNLAFTAGLLHDIGKSVMSVILEGKTEEMMGHIDSGEGSFLDAEKSIAGMDHAELGYELAQHWKLPDQLANAIKFHHHPLDVDDKYKTLVYTVHLGDVLAMMAGIGTGVDGLSYTIDPTYKEYIEIEENQLAIVIADIQDEFYKTKQALLGESPEE